MSEPVTAEELAAAGPCAVSLTSIAPYHAKAASFGGASFEFHARAQTTVERAAELLPRLARDLTAERATSARLAILCEHIQTDLDAAQGQLDALRAAVRAHEASARGTAPRYGALADHLMMRPHNQADLDLWAAAKA